MSAQITRKLLSFCLVLAATAAMGQQMYRWTDADGRVHYSDQPPPKDAKNVQTKSLGANIIETDALPYATQVARRRNPVTLYAFDCGDVCTQARNLLRARGVPFRELDTRNEPTAEKLRALTGSTDVPVLVVGDNLINGFETGRWQTALDEAGYPQSVTARQVSAAQRQSESASRPAESAAPSAKTPPAANGAGAAEQAGGQTQKVPTVAY